MQTTKAQISLCRSSLLSTFVGRCLDSIIYLVSIWQFHDSKLASVEQTGLSLEDRFSRDRPSGSIFSANELGIPSSFISMKQDSRQF